MKGWDSEKQVAHVSLEYDLEASPEMVWRAILDPALRAAWLPARDLADPEPLDEVPGERVRFGMREAASPGFASTVTFHVAPGLEGGARLRIVHRLLEVRATRFIPRAANANGPVMLAA
ncbi:MAG: hypothetical protein K9H25_19040 [Rhodospirillum sp.]|nr:hypothetical protein [Rhodospirillum sp.]MCF8489619.1 hypothetical protein [Rhodospirillum sp.]MCF8499650.1 hypothetical protein [Rhodospirillum sp.]